VSAAKRRGRKLVRKLDRASELAHRLDLALAREGHPYRTRARDLARACDRALDRALDGARVFDVELATNCYRVDAFARNLELGGVFGLDLKRGRELVKALGQARELAAGLMAEGAWPSGKSGIRVGSRRVTPSARRLVAVAARLLPAADRARYGEEYRSELWDLAAAGVGRCQQIGYAARQLYWAVPVHFALLGPRRRKASP
jgi:hypothetical protein